MKESQLQTKIKKKLEQHGWLVIKLIQTNWNGVPDLLCFRKGNTIMLEVKAEGETPKPLQVQRIETLNKVGIHARYVDCIQDIDVYCYKTI